MVGIVFFDIAAAVALLILLIPSKSFTFSPERRADVQVSPWPDRRPVPFKDETERDSPPWESAMASGVETERDFFGSIRDWARKDPEAALAWAKLQPDSDDARKEALIDACFQIAQYDPERAVILAEQFKLNRDSVLVNLAQQWASKDLTAACNWITAQPDSDQRNALAVGMTFIWAQTEPIGAARFVTEQMASGSAQDQAAMMVLHQWALKDLAAAGAWVQEFPESPLREQALHELTGIAEYKQSMAR